MKIVIYLCLIILLSSCASIKLSPKGCDSSASWGEGNVQSHVQDVTKLNEKTIEINTDKTYFVIFNHNINLRELLKEYDYNCQEIQNFRATISSKFFFFKKVSLKFIVQ